MSKAVFYFFNSGLESEEVLEEVTDRAEETKAGSRMRSASWRATSSPARFVYTGIAT